MKTVWVLDLDNTLYPASSGLFRLIDARIREYMLSRARIPEVDVDRLREDYRSRYGLTLGGLMRHHGVDPEEYGAYVHDVPIDEFLAPDPLLEVALGRLPGRRVVFTNGSARHAGSVLGRLGVAHRVERVFDLSFMDYEPKPRPHGYRKLLSALGAQPSDCWLVDDLPENLATGAALGMRTVLVGEALGRPGLRVESARELPGLLDLPR